jgi:hypothetical protein
VGSLKDNWPPPTRKEARKLRKRGQLPQWKPGGESNSWKPQKAHVFPRSKAPSSSTITTPKGVWKYRSGKEPKGLDDWETQEVMMYPTGQEPEGSANGKPHGVWGISKDAEPDEKGNWKPKDIWFYGPGETPEGDCAVHGKWTIPLGKVDSDWPPKSKLYVSPRRKVGKLKIPGTFDNKNPPPPALSPTRSPRKISASSAHSINSSSTRSKDKPPVSPQRQSSQRKDDEWRKHMGEDITFPFVGDSDDDNEVEDPLTAPPKQPVRHDTYDSFEEDDDDHGHNDLSPSHHTTTTTAGGSTTTTGSNSAHSGHKSSVVMNNSSTKEEDAHRGPKPVMAEYQSAFDYNPTSSSKKKKTKSLKSSRKKKT